MKKLATILVLLLWASVAHGQQMFYQLVRPPLPPPAIFIDFANNVGYNLVSGQSGPATGFVAVSRTTPNGTVTDLLPWSPSGYAYQTFADNTARVTPGFGLLSEGSPRGNYFVGSVNPITKASASLATTATWVMWINGPGSAAATNGTGAGCAGTATQGNPVSWTMTTTGTCTITITGTVYAIQIENNPSTLTPPIGTSFIITTTVAAIRGAEVITVNNPPALNVTYSFGTKAWYSAPVAWNAHQTSAAITDGTTTNHTWLARFTGAGYLFVGNAGTGAVSSQAPAITAGVLAPQSFGKFATAVGNNYQASSQDSFGTAQSLAAFTPQNTILNTIEIGSNNPLGNSQSLFGYLAQMAVWPNNAMTQDQLRAWTRN